MNKGKTCIVLTRPMDMGDPVMSRPGGVFAFEKVLGGLREGDVFDRVIISVPESVPQEILKVLASWRVELEISLHEQPQVRLARCMEKYGLKQVIVLTAYSVLMDAKALNMADDMVRENRADAVYPQGVIAPKYFIVLNRKAAKYLAEAYANPLPPFVFSRKLKKNKELNIQPMPGLEDQRERFLWELLFAGERNAVPETMLGRYLSQYAGEDRFSRESFDTFISSEYGLHDPGTLHKGLKPMQKYDSSLRLAMQLNNARVLAEHLPKEKNRALEIGHGKTPLTSLLLAQVFDKVFGADVYNHSDAGIVESASFLQNLENSGLKLLPGKILSHSLRSVLKRTDFFQGEVQNMPLADKSIDMCYSRMVLEHVMDVEGLSGYLERIMHSNSVMVHEIGLQDHDDLSHIHFEFLRYSKEEWLSMKRGTNLWRINDFINLFQRSGFNVETLAKDIRVVPPKHIHESWKNYSEEDLFCYRATLKFTRR